MGDKQCLSVSSFGSLKHFRPENKVDIALVEYTLCLTINWTTETFYYNFVKVALISIKIGTHNLCMT